MPVTILLGTPILFFTLRVANGLPLLADEAVHGILRKAWLRSAVCDRWMVGAYCIGTDRVSLFASPSHSATGHPGWLVAWLEITTRAINEQTRGTGPVWAGCPRPLAVDSSEDYAGLRALMETGAPDLLAVDGTLGRCEGLLWQLLPAGEPAVPSPAPLGKT